MNGKNKFLFPFMLVTSLFFLWGMAHSMLDVLNKHFQEALSISKSASGLIQLAVFGAYFLMALPAGMLLKKVGYKRGIIIGLLLYAVGAFLFYPAAEVRTFGFFLVALFIIACGLTILETAANPYVTVLGPAESSEQRLNLSQSFNGLGWILGPVIGAFLIFSEETNIANTNLSSVQTAYLGIGIVVVLVALLFTRARLPEIDEKSVEDHVSLPTNGNLFRIRHFVNGVLAQFFYVGAQVGIGAFFINYATESIPNLSNKDASIYLSVCMFLFTAGRFAGTVIMRYVKPAVLLGIYAVCNVALLLFVIYSEGLYPVYALMLVSFFMSIMFPTIFALAIKDLGESTKQGSSFVIMSIVGGAIFPPLMGYIADTVSTSASFWVPLACFAFVLWYAIMGSRVKNQKLQWA